MRKIVFIGPCGGGSVPYHGASFKNRLMVKYLRQLHYEVEVIDTENWRKDFRILTTLAIRLMNPGNAAFVVSASRGSAYRFLRLLKLSGVKSPVHYWVIGGRLAEDVESGRFRASFLRGLDSIIVETPRMKRKLTDLGFANVRVIPNFKELVDFPVIPLSTGPVRRFIFLSRIDREKGCPLIFSAARILEERGYAGRFAVDFYGKTEKSYGAEFTRCVDGSGSVSYKGFLDMTDSSGYRVLAEYDAMLFPTMWESEGFAGTLIDSMVAGLPVIASDWMSVSEIVEDHVTGLLIPPGDADALARAMAEMIDGSHPLALMKQECLRRAPAYNVKTVLTYESLSFLKR